MNIDIMCSKTSAEIIKSLQRIFMIHGLPLSVTSDNGPFERNLEGCGIKHTKTIPLWPQAKLIAKWKGRTNSFEKVADRASQGETLEKRSWQILDSTQIDSSDHHRSESS